MARRGPTSFQKRQKEQLRKEKQQEKFAKRMERKREGGAQTDEDSPEGTGQDVEAGSEERTAAELQ